MWKHTVVVWHKKRSPGIHSKREVACFGVENRPISKEHVMNLIAAGCCVGAEDDKQTEKPYSAQVHTGRILD